MTREQWLELNLRSLLDEVKKVKYEKERRGGQHVPCHSRFMNMQPSALLYLEREIIRALYPDEEYIKETNYPDEQYFNHDIKGNNKYGI
jgi:hypothetical protein